MIILKISSLFLLLISAFALRNEDAARSPAILSEATNDEKTSTEMDEDADDTHKVEFLEDGKALLDEATNDKKTSTEMELVKNDDDGKGMDKEEFLEDEKAILDVSDETRLEKRSRIACAIRRFLCFVGCRRVPRRFRRTCGRVCNFGLRYGNRAVCFFACRRVPRFVRGVCYRVCRCLRR